MMPAIGPAVRVAIKVAPVAIEVARQLDQKVRPHVRAYQLARSVGGVVGSWTANDGTHWVVFNDPGGHPLQAFPPLPEAELEMAAREIDRSTLKAHTELPEHTVKQRLEQVGGVPAGLAARVRRRGDDPDATELG
jgi:hypothetical protein